MSWTYPSLKGRRSPVPSPSCSRRPDGRTGRPRLTWWFYSATLLADAFVILGGFLPLQVNFVAIAEETVVMSRMAVDKAGSLRDPWQGKQQLCRSHCAEANKPLIKPGATIRICQNIFQHIKRMLIFCAPSTGAREPGSSGARPRC